MPDAVDHNSMPPRPTGATGWQTPLLALGGEGTVQQPFNERLAHEMIERALELDIWYIDTAPNYGRGASERRIGHAIAGRRDDVFLATKTRARTRDAAWRSLERSLKRLRTDRIDLWQLQDVRSPWDARRVFGPAGAIEALREAREQGIVHYVGINGDHDTGMLLAAIDRFAFDAVSLPLDPADVHYRPVTRCVLGRAVARGMAVIAKSVATRWPLQRDDAGPTMQDTMRWTLSHPVSTVVVTCERLSQLEEAVAVTHGFVPLAPLELRAFAARTAHYSTVPTFFKWNGNGRTDTPRRWGARRAPWRVVQEAGT